MNRSMKEFCAGFPGWMNSGSRPCLSAHSARSAETSSGPLSILRFVGIPLYAVTSSRTRTTLAAGKNVSTSRANASRLQSSGKSTVRKRWSFMRASLMASRDQQASTVSGAAGISGLLDGSRFFHPDFLNNMNSTCCQISAMCS